MRLETRTQKTTNCLVFLFVAVALQLAISPAVMAQKDSRSGQKSSSQQNNRQSSQTQKSGQNQNGQSNQTYSKQPVNNQSNKRNSFQQSSPSQANQNSSGQPNKLNSANGSSSNRRSAVIIPPQQTASNGMNRRPQFNSAPVPPQPAAGISQVASNGLPPARVRTAKEVWGAEALIEMGIPAEAHNLSMVEVKEWSAQKLVRERYQIPSEETKKLDAKQLLDGVGNLQAFDAEGRIADPKFWNDVASSGLDSALGPVVREKFGLPDGVREGALSSKILEDAASLQKMGLDLGDRNNWTLLDDYQSGKIDGNQFVDMMNKPGVGGGNSNAVNAGGVNSGNRGQGIVQTPPGMNGHDPSGVSDIPTGGRVSTGEKSSGKDAASNPNSPATSGSTGSPNPAAPGNSTSPGSGTAGGSTPGNSGTGTAGQDSGGLPASGGSGSGSGSTADSVESEDDGLVVEGTIAGGGTYVVVTHNADGGYTAVVVETDASGNESVVQSETFSDSGGYGEYVGDKGGKSGSKPKEGVYESKKTEDGDEFTYESESSSSDSDDDSSSDTDSSDTDTDSSDDTPTDDDEFTPDPEAGNIADLYNNSALMQSLYQLLSDEKFALGKGGKDSSPNPMNETIRGKKSPVDYKGTISRPVDGSSTTVTGNVQEMMQQIQDPLAIQGGVIDPNKN